MNKSRTAEMISSYLDGALSEDEKRDLENLLIQDEKVKELHQQMQLTRYILSKAPRIKAPHNFTLTVSMVKPPNKSSSFLSSLFVLRSMQFAAVLSSFMLIFAFLAEYLNTSPHSITVVNQATMPLKETTNEIEPLELAAAAPMQMTITSENVQSAAVVGKQGETLDEKKALATVYPMQTTQPKEEAAPEAMAIASDNEAEMFTLPLDSGIAITNTLTPASSSPMPTQVILSHQRIQDQSWFLRVIELGILLIVICSWGGVYFISRFRLSCTSSNSSKRS